MSPLADMLIRQHGSLDDAMHHAALMALSESGESAANWQFACAEIRAEINTTTTHTGTSAELAEMANFITQTEDAPTSVCWVTSNLWRAQ